MKSFKIILGLIILAAGIFGNATLNGFNGYYDDSRIIIQWETTAEDNVSGFEVQRSTDRRTYYELGFLHAQGQGSGYTFIDDSIIAKVSGRDYFYRLKIRNSDGSSTLSEVITIESAMDVTSHTWGSLKALFK